MENENYNIASGNDLASFINQMNGQKEHMVDDAFAGLDELGNAADPEDDDREPVDVAMRPAAANAAGTVAVTMLDTMLPAILGFIAKEDAALYKADAKQRVELEEALSSYMELNGTDIPPGWMVVILVLAIYGSQVPTAIQHRRLNEKEEALNAREAALDALAEQLNKGKEE